MEVDVNNVDQMKTVLLCSSNIDLVRDVAISLIDLRESAINVISMQDELIKILKQQIEAQKEIIYGK